jgi:hypothetical protein
LQGQTFEHEVVVGVIDLRGEPYKESKNNNLNLGTDRAIKLFCHHYYQQKQKRRQQNRHDRQPDLTGIRQSEK